MSQKPSSKGFLPIVLLARPIPRAVMSGTVIVEVVTQPLSNARGIIYFGAMKVIPITAIYPNMI